MIVPVTVIGSVVVACLLCVELVWANASGAISIRTRVTIVLFMILFAFLIGFFILYLRVGFNGCA